MSPASRKQAAKERPPPAPLSSEDEEAVREFYRFLAHEQETEIRLINAKHRYAKPPIVRPTNEEEFVQVAREQNGLREIYAGWAERVPGGSNYEDVHRVTLIPLDLDAKGEEGTIEDVLSLAEAIQAWARDKGFREPRRVASGRGVHLYWALPPLTLQTPEERAHFSAGLAAFVDALHKRFKDYPGAEVDQPVKDLARLMRVPGTLNLKTAPPRPTGLIDPLVRDEDLDLLDHVLTLGEGRPRAAARAR